MARRRSSTETPVSILPEGASRPDTTDLRIVLLQALAGLAPRARTVVVLRYWEDRSVEQVAQLLGCSAGIERQHERLYASLRCRRRNRYRAQDPRIVSQA